jgi:hypothetical protein
MTGYDLRGPGSIPVVHSNGYWVEGTKWQGFEAERLPLSSAVRKGAAVPPPPSPLIMASWHRKKKTPWPLVRERTIPTDRPPLVDEI